MKIVVMGFVCSDIYRNGGETVEQIGGSAGNIAAILGYFGKNVSLWFPGYSDIRGNELEEKLKRRGVSIVRFAITKLKTPYICLEYDEKQKKRDLISDLVTVHLTLVVMLLSAYQLILQVSAYILLLPSLQS